MSTGPVAGQVFLVSRGASVLPRWAPRPGHRPLPCPEPVNAWAVGPVARVLYLPSSALCPLCPPHTDHSLSGPGSVTGPGTSAAFWVSIKRLHAPAPRRLSPQSAGASQEAPGRRLPGSQQRWPGPALPTPPPTYVASGVGTRAAAAGDSRRSHSLRAAGSWGLRPSAPTGSIQGSLLTAGQRESQPLLGSGGWRSAGLGGHAGRRAHSAASSQDLHPAPPLPTLHRGSQAHAVDPHPVLPVRAPSPHAAPSG